MEGESSSFIVELFSSTTIMAYSTSSPLCSREREYKIIMFYDTGLIDRLHLTIRIQPYSPQRTLELF